MCTKIVRRVRNEHGARTPSCPHCVKEGKGFRPTIRCGYGNVRCPEHGEMSAADAYRAISAHVEKLVDGPAKDFLGGVVASHHARTAAKA